MNQSGLWSSPVWRRRFKVWSPKIIASIKVPTLRVGRRIWKRARQERDFTKKRQVSIRIRKIRMKSLGSDLGVTGEQEWVLCGCTWLSTCYSDHLYHSFTFKELVCRCLSVCLALNDSQIHLAGERKTFELMIILALLIFRQHPFPPFPTDLRNCNVSQLPIFGKIYKGKGTIKCLSHSLQEDSESRTKPYSRLKNLQMLVTTFEIKEHPAKCSLVTPK